LGVLFYQVLAGRLPFEAETPTAMMFQHAYEKPQPLARWVPDLPQPIIQITSRMMAKGPDERYATCEDVLADIAAYREGRALAPVPSPEADSSDHSRTGHSSEPKAGDFSCEEGEPTSEVPAADVELPADLDRLADDGPLRRARDFAATMFRRHAPQFVQDLQNTTQQVDGAVAEYERRQRRLAKLRNEALDIIAELAEQINANRQAVAAAAAQAAEAADADRAEAALARQQKCEEDLTAVESQHAEQRRQLEEIELQLAKTDARLAQLRSQRDILQARLTAAAAQQKMEGGQPSTRRIRWMPIAATAVGLVLALALFWALMSGPADKAPERIAKLNAHAAPRPGTPVDSRRDPEVALVSRFSLRPFAPARAELRQTLELGGDLRSVAFSPDGALLAATTDQKKVGIWDMATLRLQRIFTWPQNVVNTVAFSPDGLQVASAGDDDKVLLWDPRTGESHGMMVKFPKHIRTVVYSPDGSKLATGTDDQKVFIWDVATQTRLLELKGHTDGAKYVAFSPDGTQLASAGRDTTVRVWDVVDGYARATLQGHSDWVQSVAFSPDGSTIASGAKDATVKLWDWRTGELRRTIENLGAEVRAVTFSPDGRVVASGGGDQKIRVWDAGSGGLLSTLAGHTASVNHLTFSPDGAVLASASSDGTVRLWSSTTDGYVSLTKVRPSNESPQIVGPSPGITPPDFETAKLSSTQLKVSCRATLEGHESYVESVVFSPDGQTLVSASTDKTVTLWDVATASRLHRLDAEAYQVHDINFTPDGSRLVWGGGEPNTVKIYDMSTGKFRHTQQAHSAMILSVAVSPDGSLAASAGDDGIVKLWDLDRGSELGSLRGHFDRLLAVEFSRDGKTLVSAGYDKLIRQWDVATGEPLGTLEGGQKSFQTHLSFSPDGSLLAAPNNDGSVLLWNFGGEGYRAVPRGRFGKVSVATFSPDGAILALGGMGTDGASKGLIELREVATGDILASLEDHENDVKSLAFSPDGQTLASGSRDWTIRLWSIEPAPTGVSQSPPAPGT
jgi:WD40 repeat protein